MKTLKGLICIITQELFQYSLFTYVFLFLLESISHGFVSNFFNANILLGIILISGLVMVVTTSGQGFSHQPVKRNFSADIQNSILLAIAGGLIVLYKTQDLGTISITISLLTMVLIFLLSMLVLTDSEKPEKVSNEVLVPIKPIVILQDFSFQQPLLSLPAHATADTNKFYVNTQKDATIVFKKNDDYGVFNLSERPSAKVSQEKARNTLEYAQTVSQKLKKRFKETTLEYLYIEKILPYDQLILEMLQTLSEEMHGDIFDMKRERIEKLVVLYAQNLQLRLNQLLP